MRRAVLLILFAAACGDDDAGSPDGSGPAADGGDPGAPSFGEPAAFIRLSERSDNQGGAYSAYIRAQLREEPSDAYAETTREGACRLLESDSNFCAEPCDGWCDEAGACHPFPAQASAGPITFTGLSREITVAPVDGFYFWSDNGRITVEGNQVRATAPGDDFGGFALIAETPEPLVVSNLDQLMVDAGSELEIRWTPSGQAGARVRLWLHTDLGHAAIHPVVIECDVADAAGRVTVPQPMMAVYADPQHWSCGDCIGSEIYRYQSGSIGVDPIELRVASSVDLYLPVFGLTRNSASSSHMGASSRRVISPK